MTLSPWLRALALSILVFLASTSRAEVWVTRQLDDHTHMSLIGSEDGRHSLGFVCFTNRRPMERCGFVLEFRREDAPLFETVPLIFEGHLSGSVSMVNAEATQTNVTDRHVRYAVQTRDPLTSDVVELIRESRSVKILSMTATGRVDPIEFSLAGSNKAILSVLGQSY